MATIEPSLQVLEQREAQLREVLRAAGMGSWEWDPRTGEMRCSDEMLAIIGVDPAGRPTTYAAFREHIHPDDRPLVAAAIERALAGGDSYHVEARFVHGDGGVGWLAKHGQVVRDAAGQPVRLLGIAQEISERKLAEERDRLLAEAADLLASSLDYERTLQHVARLAVPRVADWCRIDMRGPGGSIELVALAHADPEKVRWGYELQRAAPPRPDDPRGMPNVLRTGRPELYPDVSDEMLVARARDEDELALLRAIGFTSVMIVPLVAREQVLGAITLVSTDPGRHYGEADLAAASDLARRAAVAVDNARLFRAEQDTRAALERALAVAPSFEDADSPQALAGAICRGAVDAFASTAASLWTVEPDAIRLLARSEPAALLPLGTRLRLSQVPDLAEGVARRRAVFYPETDVGPGPTDIGDYAQRQGIRAALLVPIVVDGVAVSLLSLTWQSAIPEPSPGLLAAAQRYADQAGLALEHLRRRIAQEDAAELHARLEKSLLPAPRLSDPGLSVTTYYRPGEHRMLLGGDFMDYLELGDGRLALLIGDVSGHGPAAAALGATLRVAWRTLAMSGAAAQATLAGMDAILLSERSSPEIFATVCVGWVDTARRELTLGLAGHLPPVLLGESVSVPDVPAGPPLGTVEEPAWSTSRVPLPERWAVLLYTDGLIEGRTRPGSTLRLGVHGLRTLVGRRASGRRDGALLEALFESARRANGGELADDIAMLLVRTVSAPAALVEQPQAAPLGLQLRLPAVAESVPEIRRALVELCGTLGLCNDTTAAVALASTEAATNVVMHAYLGGDAPDPVVEIEAWPEGDRLRVVVRDFGRGMLPRTDSPGLGLGLGLIATFAEEIDVRSDAEAHGTEVVMHFRAGDPAMA